MLKSEREEAFLLQFWFKPLLAEGRKVIGYTMDNYSNYPEILNNPAAQMNPNPAVQPTLNPAQESVQGKVENVNPVSTGSNADIPRVRRMAHPEPRVYRTSMDSDFEMVEAGKLMKARILSAELANASNGYPFMRVRCQIVANNWTMTCCHFIDRRKCGSPQEIQMAGVEYLSKFGFKPSAEKGHRYDDCAVLAEIGNWIDDSGKSHLNIKRLYKNKSDYESYQKWLAERQKKQAPRREPMELPEI